MFLKADADILTSLAHFIKGRRKNAPSVLRDFVRANSTEIRNSTPRSRKTVLRQRGRFFDLKTLFDEVNSEYFDKKIDCLITWGANRQVQNQNSIKLGSYSERTKTIRVNPALDRSYVERYVIKGIIYHEMLHHYLGVEIHNGRKIAHSKTFRRLESRYRYHDRLQAWKEKNLHRLLGRHLIHLRSSPSGAAGRDR
jgi:predicted SprT family Zn-dependent metalloprotease